MTERRPMTIPEQDARVRRNLNRRSSELAFGGWAALPATVGTIFAAIEAVNNNYGLAVRAGIATAICTAFMGAAGLFLSKDAAKDFLIERRNRRVRRR